ncbi:MAG: hypothetical protein K0Q75_290, partial [Anaerospora sp.]|nr:hypothetical protein [Anaerospora sp.]
DDYEAAVRLLVTVAKNLDDTVYQGLIR